MQSMHGMQISSIQIITAISYIDIQSSHACMQICRHSEQPGMHAHQRSNPCRHWEQPSMHTCRTTARLRTFQAARHSHIPAICIWLFRGGGHAAMQSCQVYAYVPVARHPDISEQQGMPPCSAARYADCRHSNQLHMLTFQSS
jgi:hypothetical protein